jgi:transglutaminase-like putative cysteine protease
MNIDINTHFAFELDDRADVLLQFEVAPTTAQQILAEHTSLTVGHESNRIAAQDGIGTRLWLRANGLVEVNYTAQVAITRSVPEMACLAASPLQYMPAEAVQYLLDSHYCPASQFQPFVIAEFSDTQGGARVEQIRSWIARNFTYEAGVSDARTDARDSFVERRGICRDYAHVMVTMARASGIPARYAAGYAPGVNPPDFHAVAEVFLEDPSNASAGTWHVVDATGMATGDSFAKIGVGRDAADVSFLSAFGPCDFLRSEVSVTRSDHE